MIFSCAFAFALATSIAREDSPEVHAPKCSPPAPQSVEGDWRSHNKQMLQSFATCPSWDPFRAPWPQGTVARWWNQDIYYGIEYAHTQAVVDLCDHHAFFWTR